MKGIFLVRTGSINVVANVSLIDLYSIQELYARCSYGAYAFFASQDSKHKKSKFTLVAKRPGQYFYLKYSLLGRLAESDSIL